MPPLKNAQREAFALAVARGAPIMQTYVEVWRGDASLSRPSLAQKASRVSTDPKVQARIAEIRAQFATRTTITAQRVLEELAKIGFTSMGDMIEIDEDGKSTVNLAKLTPEQKAAISEIEIFTNPEGKQRVKVKLHDKRAALMDIGKHLGMFREKVELSGPNGAPIQTASQIEVNLLNREERGMLKDILLAMAERKAQQEKENESFNNIRTIEHDPEG